MMGWLAEQSGITRQQIQACPYEPEIREDVVRRMTARAVVVLRLCTLRPQDLQNLHYLELAALEAARQGLTMPAEPAQDDEADAEDAALMEMLERATGGA